MSARRASGLNSCLSLGSPCNIRGYNAYLVHLRQLQAKTVLHTLESWLVSNSDTVYIRDISNQVPPSFIPLKRNVGLYRLCVGGIFLPTPMGFKIDLLGTIESFILTTSPFLHHATSRASG